MKFEVASSVRYYSRKSNTLCGDGRSQLIANRHSRRLTSAMNDQDLKGTRRHIDSLCGYQKSPRSTSMLPSGKSRKHKQLGGPWNCLSRNLSVSGLPAPQRRVDFLRDRVFVRARQGMFGCLPDPRRIAGIVAQWVVGIRPGAVDRSRSFYFRLGFCPLIHGPRFGDQDTTPERTKTDLVETRPKRAVFSAVLRSWLRID